MPRHLRVTFPGAIYHITIRGNARQRIFTDDRDRERFLARLAESVQTYRIRLYLFCLMDNHVHLLLETPDTNLSRFMQSLETGYTVYYNLRHNKVGHLFQGRYGAKLVEGDEYLLRLTRYIHLNPVYMSGMKTLPMGERIRRLRGYRWSSYRSYAGMVQELEYVTYGPALAQVGGKKRQWKRLYKEFVEEGIVSCDDEFLVVLKKSPHAIGGDDFLAWARDIYLKQAETQKATEDIAFRREARRIPAGAVISTVCSHLAIGEAEFHERRRNSIARPVVARMLSKYAGWTNRVIASMLGLRSAGTVTYQVRKAAEVRDRKARAQITAIEAKLACMMRKPPGDSPD